MDEGSWNVEALVAAHVASDRSTPCRVRHVVAWLLEDPARGGTVEDLARRAAVSPRTFSRHFRRETGTTPARFIERARMRLARGLLERCGSSVGWVAERAGFRNSERMRRAFHRAFGAGPRAYASSGCGTMRR